MNSARLQAIRQAKGYHVLPVKAGQQIEIHETVGQEGNRRTWKFRGLVLTVKKPNHPDGTFTIRGKIAGATIEKIYPLSFNNFEKVLLVDEYKTRRAKLYYLRDKVGKDTRMTSVIDADQKGIDLLKLAKEQAQQEHEAYQAAQQDQEKEQADDTAEETAVDSPENQQDKATTSTDDAAADDTEETKPDGKSDTEGEQDSEKEKKASDNNDDTSTDQDDQKGEEKDEDAKSEDDEDGKNQDDEDEEDEPSDKKEDS